MGRKRGAGAAAAVVSVVALVAAAVAWAGPGSRHVQVLDNCDGPSFNATIGPGTCNRNGGLSFEQFFAALARGGAPSWRFSPDELKVEAGGTITANNRGGEFHTFTPVAAFGGGCVPELNGPLGLSPVPECAIPGIFDTTGAGPGASVTTGSLGAGTHRFLCLIHPWMRTTVSVG
jgi:plastocyanin